MIFSDRQKEKGSDILRDRDCDLEYIDLARETDLRRDRKRIILILPLIGRLNQKSPTTKISDISALGTIFRVDARVWRLITSPPSEVRISRESRLRSCETERRRAPSTARSRRCHRTAQS